MIYLMHLTDFLLLMIKQKFSIWLKIYLHIMKQRKNGNGIRIQGGFSMDKLPKYIEQKCDKLNKLLETADQLKNEIEKWAESKGIDTCSNDWDRECIDDCSAVKGIYKDGLLDLINYECQ